MRLNRIYYPKTLTLNDNISLEKDIYHYIIKVLRMKINYTLILFNGNNIDYYVKITEIHKNTLQVHIFEEKTLSTYSQLDIHLGQVIAKGNKMDWIIQKSTELGINSFTPLLSSRCDVKITPDKYEKKREQWQKQAQSASEQCHRGTIPIINPIQTIEHWFNTPTDAQKLLLHPRNGKTLKATLSDNKKLLLLVGPEGGLTDKEIYTAIAHHFQTITLGNRVLRTETASLAMISALHAYIGDFQ